MSENNLKSVGIIIAKKNSNRFKDKNKYPVAGIPLFWHSVKCLIDAGITNIYVATDSEYIRNYCNNRDIHVINRKINITEDNQTWFDVIKYCYYTLPLQYDAIVSILANCINHTPADVISGITLLQSNPHIKEIRSFNSITNEENGIIILRSEVLKKHEISNYLGYIATNGTEIHYKEDLKC